MEHRHPTFYYLISLSEILMKILFFKSIFINYKLGGWDLFDFIANGANKLLQLRNCDIYKLELSP